MLERIKEHQQIKRVKKNMTEREKAIFDFCRASANGVTSEECKEAIGYAMSGWVYSRFKECGVILGSTECGKRWYVKEILA